MNTRNSIENYMMNSKLHMCSIYFLHELFSNLTQITIVSEYINTFINHNFCVFKYTILLKKKKTFKLC